MKHYRKSGILAAACLFLCALFVTGCGQEEKVYVPVTSDSIETLENGRLIAYIVEDFDKDYYDIMELDAMVREEIEQYNAENAALSSEAGRAPVIVEKVSMAEDGSEQAVVALNFQNAAVYEDYMGKELFYGTVSEAVEAGYQLEGVLTSVKKGEALTAEQIAKYGERHIVIAEDAVWIRVNEKVQYLSANVTMTQEGYVDGSSSEELKYIITK